MCRHIDVLGTDCYRFITLKVDCDLEMFGYYTKAKSLHYFMLYLKFVIQAYFKLMFLFSFRWLSPLRSCCCLCKAYFQLMQLKYLQLITMLFTKIQATTLQAILSSSQNCFTPEAIQGLFCFYYSYSYIHQKFVANLKCTYIFSVADHFPHQHHILKSRHRHQIRLLPSLVPTGRHFQCLVLLLVVLLHQPAESCHIEH